MTQHFPIMIYKWYQLVVKHTFQVILGIFISKGGCVGVRERDRGFKKITKIMSPPFSIERHIFL